MFICVQGSGSGETYRRVGEGRVGVASGLLQSFSCSCSFFRSAFGVQRLTFFDRVLVLVLVVVLQLAGFWSMSRLTNAERYSEL
jgi:hypothetical protein